MNKNRNRLLTIVLVQLFVICGATALAQTSITVTSPTGTVTRELPAEGGPFEIDLPLASNAVNTITVSAKDEFGNTASEEIAITQISLDSVVVAEVTSEPLTPEEIEELVNEGVIDLEDPENYNVSRFVIVITVENEPVEIVVYLPQGASGGPQGGEQRAPMPDGDGPAGRPPPSPREVVIFEELIGMPGGAEPVSLPGVLVIEGRIKSLKEFFSVRLLLLNTSGIFTLSDVSAEIVIPEHALSHTLPLSGRVLFDDILPGDGDTPGQAEREFIIRGDQLGLHDVRVDFGGVLTGPGIPEDAPVPFGGDAHTDVEVKGPPTFQVQVYHPDSVVEDQAYDLRVDITNTGEVPALYASLDLDVGMDMELVHCVLDETSGDPECEMIDGPVTRALGHIYPAQRVSETFEVRSKVTGLIASCVGMADQNITLQVTVGQKGCMAGHFPTEEGVPEGVPTVSLLPAANMTGVNTSSAVTAFFSQLMKEASITAGENGSFNVFHGPRRIPGLIRFDEIFGKTVAVWQVNDGLTNRLAPNTEYTVLLTEQITNVEGVAIYNEWMSTFSTTGDAFDDITPPELSLSVETPVDPNLVLPGQVVRINAYASDQGSGVARVELRLKDKDTDGARYELIDQRSVSAGDEPPYIFAIESADLVPGHAYQALGTAYDSMGNPQDASLSLIIAASADPPTILLPEDPDRDWLQGISLDVTPVETTGGTYVVRYYLDGDAEPLKTVYLAPFKTRIDTLELAFGVHSVRAVAEDGLAQTGEDLLEFNLVENPSMPQVDFGSSVDGSVYVTGESFVVNGHAEDEVGVAKVEYYLDEINKSLPIAEGTDPFLFDTTGLATGDHLIHLVATNELGITNDAADPESYLEFKVVEQQPGSPPDAPIISSVSAPVAGQVTVTGTSVPGARVDITNDTRGFTVSVYADAGGAYIGTIDGAGGDQISAVAVDASQSPEPSESSTSVVPMPPVLEQIRVLPAELSFDETGASADLSVTAFYQGGEEEDVTSACTFNTDNAPVASVGNTGTVVAHASGEAAITASYQGQQDSCTVSVEILTLTHITVAPSEILFEEIGDDEQLVVTGHYSDSSTQVLEQDNTFATGDLEVVSVDLLGLVTARGRGLTTITVSRSGVEPVTVPVEVSPDETDTTPPEVITTEPEAQTLFNFGDTVTVVIEATDEVGVREIRYETTGVLQYSESQVIDPPARSATASFTFDVPYGVEGTEVWIHGFATDTSDNEGQAAAVPIELTGDDITPPATEATSTSDPGSGATTTITYQVTEGLEDLDHVELYFRKDAIGTFNRFTDAPGGNADGHYNPTGDQGTIPFDSTRMGGDGEFEFYTVGVDVARNREAAPDDGTDAILADLNQTIAAGTAWRTIDSETLIAAGDTTYDNQNLRISGATVTLEGRHEFHNVELVAGVLTHQQTDLDGEYSLDLSAWTITLDSTSTIELSGRGYLGGMREGNDCPGQTIPGLDGSTQRSGGSHGGIGAIEEGVPGEVYGDLTAPTSPGSGGSCGTYSRSGGDGGGAFEIHAINLVNDGRINADGVNGGGNGAGSGAGGSIYLVLSTLSGSGRITANGAVHELGGGGGRIAIHFTDLSTFDKGLLEAVGGRGSWAHAGNGTVFLKGTDESAGTLVVDGQGVASAFTSLPVPPGYVFDNIILQNSARTIADDLLEVSDSLEVLTGSILTHSTGSELGLCINARRVYVDETSSIDLSARGYRGGLRDGNTETYGLTLDLQAGAESRAGGSYGGLGAINEGAGNNLPYSHAKGADYLGSGGSAGTYSSAGGNGGGRVTIQARNEVHVQGSIRANGQNGNGNGAGSGSGGSVSITTSLLKGSGWITTDGAAHELGGGGGRVLIDYAYISTREGQDFGGLRQITSFGGHGSWNWGSAGTVLLRRNDQQQGDLFIDDNVAASRSSQWTPLVLIGFGEIIALSDDTITTDGVVDLLPGGLVGIEINPNLSQEQTFVIIANTETTITVDTSAGTRLTDVAEIGDTYVGVYGYDNITFRRGGWLVTGDRVVVAETVLLDEYSEWTHFDATLEFTSMFDLEVETLDIQQTASINLDGRGYLGGNKGSNDCSGQTIGNSDGSSYRSGGSHGGIGGAREGSVNPVYGSLTQPRELGSGGSCGDHSRTGGDGGGRGRVVAQSIILDGAISAGGLNGGGNGSGSGSGGSLRIRTLSLSGSGVLRANGAAGEIGGGGGRIVVEYDVLELDQSHVEVLGGRGSWEMAGNGTLHLLSSSQSWGELVIDGHGASTPAASSPIPGGYEFDTITLRGAAQVVADDGIEAHGTLRLAGGSVLTHSTESESGLQIDVATLEVDETSSIDLSGRGYRGGLRDGNASEQGLTLGEIPGAEYRTGGSYGGFGGVNEGPGNNLPYGHPAQPVHLGSGGSNGSHDRAGGNGGGLVRISASEGIHIAGAIRADGHNGGGSGSGSGSGGSIQVQTALLEGSGSISAAGAAHEVGGGGGRVAITYTDLGGAGQDFEGLRSITALGGHGTWVWGSAGTVWLEQTGRTRGELIIDDNQVAATTRNWTPLTQIGFGESVALTSDTITLDGTVAMLPGGLVGVEINPNLDQGQTFTVVSNTETTLTVDISTGTLLTDVAQVGDGYAGVYHFDDLTFRRGGYLVAGDRLLVEEHALIDEYGRLTHFDATLGLSSRLDFEVGSLEITATGSIDADGRGYLGGLRGGNVCEGQTLPGLAGSTYRSGGSHGGLGGAQDGGIPNPAYGEQTAPIALGSGGSCGSHQGAGGDGGGFILIAADEITLEGTITAGGNNGGGNGGGSGSGGSIQIHVGDLYGTGLIRANGAAHEVGGGGGRVAIIFTWKNLPDENITAAGGHGSWQWGADGTVYLP